MIVLFLTLLSLAKGSVNFGFVRGSAYNELSSFVFPLNYELMQAWLVFPNVLFNTAGQNTWVELGAVYPAVLHACPQVGCQRLIRGQTLSVSEEMPTFSDDVTVRHMYQKTMNLGGGELNASPLSRFSQRVGAFSIHPKFDGSFQLVAGPRNPSLSWIDVPVVDFADQWVVRGIVKFGSTEESFPMRINTGRNGIGLPAHLFDEFTQAFATRMSLAAGSVIIRNCDRDTTIQQIQVVIGGIEFKNLVFPKMSNRPSGTQSCLLRLFSSESPFVELGEPFMRLAHVRLDSSQHTVSFSPVDSFLL